MEPEAGISKIRLHLYGFTFGNDADFHQPLGLNDVDVEGADNDTTRIRKLKHENQPKRTDLSRKSRFGLPPRVSAGFLAFYGILQSNLRRICRKYNKRSPCTSLINFTIHAELKSSRNEADWIEYQFSEFSVFFTRLALRRILPNRHNLTLRASEPARRQLPASEPSWLFVPFFKTPKFR